MTFQASVLSDPLAATIVAVIAAVVSAVLGLAQARIAVRAQEQRESSFEDRVEVLVSTLREAGATVSQLEKEINARQEAVEKLRDQQEALKLTDEQREAVNHLLRSELEREGNRQSWKTFGVTLIVSG